MKPGSNKQAGGTAVVGILLVLYWMYLIAKWFFNI